MTGDSPQITFERSVKATSMPWIDGTRTKSSYIGTKTSGGLEFGLKFGASQLVSDGVCRMACISGCDCIGLDRINSCYITHKYSRLTAGWTRHICHLMSIPTITKGRKTWNTREHQRHFLTIHAQLCTSSLPSVRRIRSTTCMCYRRVHRDLLGQVGL